MKVIAYDTARYPDVSVTWRPFGDKDDNVSEPVLVIESLSTERDEPGGKKFDYFATPSIQQYATIEQDARRVDLYTRSGDRWTDEIVEGDAVLKLSSIGVEIRLDTVYEDTELDATQLREDGREAPAR
jgi:Uma2 family endonuclease